MAKGIEKRREKRIRVKLPIRISYQGKELSGETENISRLGAYVEIDKDIPFGAELGIALKVPAYGEGFSLGEEISCKGSVFRSSPAREENSIKYYGLGIFFTDFPQQTDREKLSSYIDFLVSQEEQEVKEEVRRWHQKRDVLKESNVAGRTKIGECLVLLKQILGRLDEMYRQAQLKNKTR